MLYQKELERYNMLKNLWNKIKAAFDFNRDGKVSAEDAVLAQAIVESRLKKANEAINQRAKRVKEEFKDVKEAATEVVNQAGDVVAAAKGKKRTGRKKK